MTRFRFLGFFGLLLFLNLLAFAAEPGFTIDESKIRLEITDIARVSLPVTSRATQATPSYIDLQFVDTGGRSAYTVRQPVTIAPGSNSFNIALPEFLKLPASDSANYGWLRMKYSIAGEVTGIVSVSRLARELFVLKVVTPRDAISDSHYRVQVLTHDPAGKKPAGGVAVSGTLDLDGDPKPTILRATARTGADGFAVLDFDLPVLPLDSDGELEVTARLGNFVRTAGDSISIANRLQILLNSDKPIYQPGQKMQVRMLAFDSQRKSQAKVPMEVSISDASNDKVFETQLSTSSYGEAHFEWNIPDNARLGEYDVEVNPVGAYGSHHFVKVDRYDLPNFTVAVHPDRSYYVSNQNALVEIRTDYLFGQPVKNGSVRVVREVSRHWNHRELRWDVEEGDTHKGTSDDNGLFKATLDLEKDHTALEERDYSQYRDIQYAAYVTDPTTNRTEQRRFDIRISRYPIDLYLVRDTEQIDGLPLEFFVTATYADGSPAECTVEILDEATNGRLLRSAKTNKYGVAKVTGMTAPPQWDENPFRASLELRARDSEGKTGAQKAYFYTADAGLRVHTNKSLYRATEPIAVTVESSYKTGVFVLSAIQNGKIVYNKTVELTGGQASATIPNLPEFKGDVMVSAFYVGATDSSESWATRSVLFPNERDLQLEASTNKTSYSPGKPASMRFRLRNTDGSPAEGLLGIAIIDKAVGERAQTDREFGRDYSFCPYCSNFLQRDMQLGGVAMKDLDHVDRRHVPADLELVAEVMLAARGSWLYRPELLDNQRSAQDSFRNRIDFTKLNLDQLRLIHTLTAGEADLRALLLDKVPDFAMLADPWDNPYHLRSSVDRSLNRIELTSAGPDEVVDTDDDFVAGALIWPYFTQYGSWISNAIQNYHATTGNYVRDLVTLKAELNKAGHDFDSWRSPWGQPYRAEFGIHEVRYTVTIMTRQPSGTEDFSVWSGGVDYTATLSAKLDAALVRYSRETSSFPGAESELSDAFQREGISPADLNDVWGRPYYHVFRTQAAYVDRITYRSGAEQSRNITPVTQEIRIVRLRSAGPDGKEGTADDFTAVSLLSPTQQQAAEDANPLTTETVILDSARGALRGVVTDSSGALIPGVTVSITRPDLSVFNIVTDESGAFLVRNLEPGNYRVSLALPGFRTKVLTNIAVHVGVVTNVTSTLEVASVASSVEVNVAVDSTLMTTSASVGAVVQGRTTGVGSGKTDLLGTPRLREYFPETLLWQPALKTDGDGTAQVRFKMADSVTTWKVTAMASTRDGRIGMVEKEILSTQPFFLEHDPPKMLTQGDEISLPIVVRSYLDKHQSLQLSMKEEDWFTSLDSSSRTLNVGAGETRKEVYSYRAVNTVKDGKQRVTGVGDVASDAIEKKSSVHPNGQEIQQTSNRILRGDSRPLNVFVPANAIPGSIAAEVKIYPNLMSHVVDSFEGIMQRPYGCAEQTISSAYPSLLLLRYNKKTGQRPDATSGKAMRYLQIAYARLGGYQRDSGGFAYWTHGDASEAVTAYAIQFLHEAGDFIPVDESLIRLAYDWLAQQQSNDGSWRSDASVTAKIVEVLSTPGIRKRERDPVPRALEYLRKNGANNEPYPLAAYALAASNAGDKEGAAWALQRLESMVRAEDGNAYWDLQTNTPFYSWGLPGRIETTALAVRALAADGAARSELLDKGVAFLLRNKDRYGVWYSTQATVRVLDALVTLVDSRSAEGEGTADILVNGTRVGTLRFGSKQHSTNPVTLDVSRFLSVGTNQVEVRERKHIAAASAQVLESHYIPWTTDNPSGAPGLRFSVLFDKTDVAISESITARVHTERVGFRGYGMLLAEIGLPPGAEVDRASLESAVAKTGWDLQRYDVQPDRIVVYLWPRAGGTEFEFKFKPRYGIRALAPASTIYDYYNPEERAVVKPTAFTVQ